jgi:hypothetical protein
MMNRRPLCSGAHFPLEFAGHEKAGFRRQGNHDRHSKKPVDVFYIGSSAVILSGRPVLL